MAVINNMVVPEVLNNYRCYDLDGNRLIGVTSQVQVAALQLMTAEVSGAGIGGTYNTPIVGKTQSIQQEIPFKMLYAELTQFMDHTKQTGVCLRGAMQCRDNNTGVIKMAQCRYVVRGNAVSVTPGNLNVGEQMGSSVTFEALYILFEVDGKKLIEIDKLSDKFVVNDEDITEEIRKMC